MPVCVGLPAIVKTPKLKEVINPVDYVFLGELTTDFDEK